MFSFESLPIDIEGFALQGSGVAKNLFHESGQPRIDFAEVLSGLKGPNGEIDVKALADNPQMLQDLGISKDQANWLFELINNGKSLPDAAQDVLFALQNEIANVLQNMPAGGPNISMIEKLQALESGMQGLMQLLPEEMQFAIAESLEELHGLMNWLQLVKQQIEAVQAQDSKLGSAVVDDNPAKSEKGKSDQQSNSTASVATTTAALQNEASLTVDKSIELKQGLQAQVTAKPLTPNDIAEPKQVDNKLSAQAQQSAQSAANTRLQNEVYGAMEDVSSLKPDPKLMAEARILQNNQLNVLQNRGTQPVSISELSASAHMMGRMGAESSSGNLMGQSSGGQSFTQLMSQTSPHPISQNLHRPEWANAVGQRLTWMIGNKMQGAQIRITPAHLGPVDIRISIENNMAQVSFVSQHQVVRDALEQAIPRLKDMLEGQNLDLADVDISDRRHTGEEQRADGFLHLAENGSPSEGSVENSGEINEESVQNVRILHSDSLLDLYA